MKNPLALSSATAICAALVLAATAAAYDKPQELQRVASVFAMRSAEVRCPSIDEWINDPIWGTAPNPAPCSPRSRRMMPEPGIPFAARAICCSLRTARSWTTHVSMARPNLAPPESGAAQ